MKTKSNGQALLEIGVEEIPARFMPDALRQLREFTTERLNTAGLPFASLHVYGTPRRLVATIDGLPQRSNDRTDIAVGPPPQAAKDAQGNWTPAATGFAKAQKVAVSALVVQTTPKGERYVAIHHAKGQKTEAILKEIFPAVMQRISFPKSMIWESRDISFARPIRWILALHNANVIRFKFAGIASDRATIGLLSLGGEKIKIPNVARYKSILQGRCILVDQDERKKNISSQLESIAKKTKSNPVVSDDHLEEVIYLTEYPGSIVGHFPDAYLALPREVLISVLKKHQKFFPLETSKKQLLNSFVGVRNGTSEAQEEVREGYERVVNARFADAKFFFERDGENPLDQLVPKLSEVGFHAKLGSMLDKTKRVQQLTQKIGSALSLSESILVNADKAAHLSKADLLTQMVGEFPELQGIAGRFYADHQQQPNIVSSAIEQHYWPISAESLLPMTDEAALVAVADKMDTLAANFSVGLVPTGSADPYGLRRMSAGVVRILVDRKWNISVDALLHLAFENLTTAVEPKAVDDLREFFKQRLVTLFTQQGYRVDEIDAVLSARDQSLVIAQEKLKALKVIRGKPEFEALSVAIKRTNNLLKQANAKNLALQADGLGEQEQKLHRASMDIRARFFSFVNDRRFEDGLLLLVQLKNPIDTYFKEVMVMVDDQALREQRLAVLNNVKELFDSVADFSKLQTVSAKTN